MDGNADLWLTHATVENAQLPVREGDDVLIVLPENRTTRWQWLDEAAVERRNSAMRFPGPRHPAPTPTSSITRIRIMTGMSTRHSTRLPPILPPPPIIWGPPTTRPL